MRPVFKMLLICGVILAALVAVIALMPQGSNVQEVSFATFYADAANGKYRTATVSGSDVEATYRTPVKNPKEPKADPWERVRATLPPAQNIGQTLLDWKAAGKLDDVNATKPSDMSIGSFLLGWGPIIVIIVVLIVMSKQQSAGASPTKTHGFGRAKARGLNKDAKRVTFADVAGCDEAKAELHEIVDFLKEPGKFSKLGGQIPRGLLLMGPPGTGKTLLAKAIAGEAKAEFLSIAGSDFVEMYVGVGASRVRDLFEQGKKVAPCIIFIDEIDAVGRHRGGSGGSGHDERDQTLNQLLVEMDGFSGNQGVVVIAATNRPDVLDSALLRPGRFDRRVVVERPDLRGRVAILKVHTDERIPLAEDVDLEVIARGTPGFAGADLANLCNEAALYAARNGSDKVSMSDFEHAKDKVYMGSERRSLVMTDQDRKITAYHEAGHTVVAAVVPHSDPVHKVTIIPRGRALGVTWQLPERDRYNTNRDYMESRIAVCMGGRAAEILVLNQYSTGASNDIQQATNMAKGMVMEYGMSEKLGPIRYAGGQQDLFLGRDTEGRPDMGGETARIVDTEIQSIVTEQWYRAVDILTTYRGAMDEIAEALLAQETLDGDEVAAIMARHAVKAREESDLTATRS